MNSASSLATTPIPLARTTSEAVDIADYLLHVLMAEQATDVWIDPMTESRHRITIEGGGAAASVTLGDGLGDAVLARLAIIADLDLSSARYRAAAVDLVDRGEHGQVVISLRNSVVGLGGELRRVEERTLGIAGHPDCEDGELKSGTRVGHYRVVRRLGHGGMGVVYEVEHRALAKRFAMKVVSAESMAQDPTNARRFVREARAAARIHHPGIVAVTDFGVLPSGRPYLVMDLLTGHTLLEVIREKGAVDPLEAVDWVLQAARALHQAHLRGVIHRDVTPANLFLVDEPEPRIVIVDFGTASTPDPLHQHVPDAPPGMVIGTPHYMAPEHIQGYPADVRSDLYGLGVVLFELIAGRRPFEGKTAIDIARAHLNVAIPTLASASGEPLPEELVTLSRRLLAKNPDERVACAGELIAALERCSNLLHRRGWRRWLAP